MSAKKTYKITMTDGSVHRVTADIINYDTIGNLIFFDQNAVLQTPSNPEGISLEIVKCYNSRHYISYEQANTEH